MSTILVDHDFCQTAWLTWFNSDMRIKYDRTCQRSIKIISIEKTFALHKSAQKKHFSLDFFLKESSWLVLFNHLKIANFEKMIFYPGWYLKTNSEIHHRSTSFLNLNFHCPVFKKNTEGGQTFNVRMIRNWNELSADVKKAKNVKSFKNKLFTNLIITYLLYFLWFYLLPRT